MMALFSKRLPGMLLVLALSMQAAAGAGLPLWVTRGERLSYRVYLWGIPAGGAEFYYAPQGAPHPREYRIIARLWTAGAMAHLFRVRDRVRVDGVQDVAANRLFLTRGFHQRLHEGGYRANRAVTYDRRAGQVTFVNRRAPTSKPQVSRLLSGMRDMFSALYYLRATMKGAQAGNSFTLPVHDLTRSYRLKVVVVGRQRLDTALGRVQTLVVRPEADGVGRQHTVRKHRLRIWITDDQRRLPVRLQMNFSAGSFRADLAHAGPPGSSSQAPADLPEAGPIGVPRTTSSAPPSVAGKGS